MKIIALVILILLLCSWGPITHEKIAEGVGCSNPAFYSGVVMVDVALAKDSSDGIRQGKFHSPLYLAELKKLAVTDEQTYFVKGWECHLIADGVQNEWNALLKPAVSMDYGVDRLIGSSSKRVSVSDSVADMMVTAWRTLYDDSVTADWIKSVVSTYNFYLSGIHIPVSKVDAEKWFTDYQVWVDKAIQESKKVLAIVIVGDVNNDGKVSIVDAMMIAQYTANIIELTSDQLSRADASKDGRVTIVDAMYIAQYVVGLRGL